MNAMKWTTIAVVGLMLLAMAMYIMSEDESVVPGEPIEQPVSAQTE